MSLTGEKAKPVQLFQTEDYWVVVKWSLLSLTVLTRCKTFSKEVWLAMEIFNKGYPNIWTAHNIGVIV